MIHEVRMTNLYTKFRDFIMGRCDLWIRKVVARRFAEISQVENYRWFVNEDLRMEVEHDSEDK